MKKLYALLLGFLLFTNAQAQVTNLQRAWSNWMGSPMGLTLRNGGPSDFSTLPAGGNGLPWSNSYIYSGEMAAAWSDSLTGNVRFVAGFRSVYDRNYDTVANGYGLFACGSIIPMIVPDPGGQNKYYVFHSVEDQGSTGGLQTICSVYGGISGASAGNRYSVLDGNYNNGLGRITDKNLSLPGGGGDQFAQVRHANGRDLWLVGHGGNWNVFTRALIDPTGITGLPMSTVTFPKEPQTSAFYRGGVMDAAPDGSRIAVASVQNRLVNIYRFNKANGDVDYDTSIAMPDNASEVCFSPDGSKLYVSTYNYGNCYNAQYRLYQVDLSAADRQGSVFEIARISNSALFKMRRVPGGHILVQLRYEQDANYYTLISYGLIASPNQPQNASSFRPGYYLSSAASVTVPIQPNDLVRQAPEAAVTRFELPADTAVCFGTYTLTAPAGHAEYRWSNGATGASITVSEPGLYSVLAGPAGFDKPAAYGYTRVRSKALPMNLGADTLLCPKTSFTLNIPAGFTNLLWQDGDTAHRHVIADPGGLQVVSAIDANGCRTRDSVCVRMKYQPRAEFGPDTTLCGVSGYLLRMEPWQYFTRGGEYLWSNGNITDSLRITAAGSYWGRVTYEGCTISDTITVSFINNITLNSRDTSLCNSDTLRLGVQQAGLRYRWNTGDTTQYIVVRAPGFYSVRTVGGPCEATAGITVAARPAPEVNLGPDRFICPGESAYLYNSWVSGSFLWSTSATTTAIQAPTPGLYWLQVTGTNGCRARDTVLVAAKSAPVVNLGADTTLCAGNTLSLQAFNPGAVYQWSSGSNASTYTVTDPGTYWVAVSLNDCWRRDTITVRYERPAVFDLGPDTVLCPRETLLLQPPPQDGQYRWQDGSAGHTYEVRTAGLYSLQVRNACGIGADSILVSTALCEALLPTAFSPNGDGVNDVFRLRHTEHLRSFRLSVFDRMGRRVFETSTFGAGWDGNLGGRPLPADTYMWQLSYVDRWGVAGNNTGQVVLVR